MAATNASRTEVISPPAFVGRDSEVAALQASIARPPGLVLIEGAPGIGKTRLLRHVLSARPAQQRTLVAECLPFPDPFTLGPLVDAIRQATDRVDGLPLTGLAGALRPLFPEWSQSLPPAPEPAEDATAARHRLFRALAEMLGCLGVGVLAVEDVHWADQATLQFLLFLAGRQPHPMVLVVTYRAEEVPSDSLVWRLSSCGPGGVQPHSRLVLAPFDVGGTAALVSSMLAGERVSMEFAEFLHQRTDGVPLAVEESVRLMGDRADVTRQGGAWVRRRLEDLDVPRTIRDSVLARVRQLGPEARAVLEATAVLGEPVRDTTLVDVTDLPPDRARDGLGIAVSSGLVDEDARSFVSFRHTLAGRAVYEAIPASQRRALHLRAGDALRQVSPPPLIRLAHHYRRAGDVSNWSRYGEEAADLALASGDDLTAAALLYDLLTAVELPAEIVRRLMVRFPPVVLVGDRLHETLLATLRNVLDRATLPHSTAAEIRFHMARLLMLTNEQSAACTELERAIPDLAHDPAISVRAMMWLARSGGATVPAAERLRLVAGAARMQVPWSNGADRLRVTIDRVSALLFLGVADAWSEAAQIPDTGETAEERWQVTRAALTIGDAAMIWGRYALAGERLRRGLEMVRQHGPAILQDEFLATQAHLDWYIGHWDKLAERASALDANVDLQSMGRVEALVVAGHLHAAEGDDARADECLGRAVEEADRRGAIELSGEPAAALAALWLRQGRVDEALRITEKPATLVVRQGIWLYATDIGPARVDALLAAGRIEDASALAAAFERGMRDLDAPAPQAALLQCRAALAEHLGEPFSAAALFEHAAAAWAAMPRPYDAALADEQQADCLLAAGRDTDAVALLSTIHDTLRTLGASADAERVMATLRAQGVPPRRRAGRPSYGDRLSPRELEVVRLLVPGRSNPEIAAALVLSPRTVARHLDSAMRKLRVSSRTALAVRAVETGLIEPAEGLGAS